MPTRLLSCFLVLSCSLTGCGLFGDLPEFSGREGNVNPDIGSCQHPSDCADRPGMEAGCEQNSCVYGCAAGFEDLDDDPQSNGCECRIKAEVCDGTDNDCDGIVDNLFANGRITAGGGHTCVATAVGDIYCWGDNEAGQLGLGTRAASAWPKRLPASDELQAAAISAGEAHTCIVDGADGAVFCWGSNAAGQIGDGQSDDVLRPFGVEASAAALDVAAGASHTCATYDDETTRCWGANAHGQLGTGATTSAPMPEAVDTPQTFDRIDAGTHYTCALTSPGAAYCWGQNADGQLGTGDTEGDTTPARIDSAQALDKLALSATKTCGRISLTGDLLCWGADSASPSPLPEDEKHPAEFIDFAVDDNGTICGITTEGNTRCRVGDSWEEFNGYKFTAIASGDSHTCAISESGRVWCWGSNSDGQIGNGTTGGTVPQPLAVMCE